MKAMEGSKAGKNDKNKKKILIVHNYYQIPGGEDTVVANEKKLLEDHGHEVLLYTRHNNELKVMSKLQKLFLPFTTIYNPRTARDVRRIIREEKIDIVHVHNTLNLISPSVYYASRKCGVPVVQTIHNFRLLCPGATFYRDGHICEDCVSKGLRCSVKHGCYRGSKVQTLICMISMKIHRWIGIYGKIYYICLTEFNKEKLLNLKQIKEDRVFIKPNFVDSNEALVSADKRKDQFVFAGRLDKLKGIDLLLQAWKKIGEKAPKLIACGTGPLKDWSSEFVAENKCNVELRGFVPNEETKVLIANSKGVILPTQWYEGFPMIIVEAFSVGNLVLCSDLGNAGSIVKEGVTGYKFQNDSVDGIVEAVEKTEVKPLDYEKIYKMYREKYSGEVNYKMLKEIYDRVQYN